MAEEVLSYEDVCQQYQGNLVFYKGEPVNVIEVDRDGAKVSIRVLRTQKTISVAFNLKDFKAPIGRLGMLNTKYGAVYLSRIPVRRMNIGINSENLVVGTLPAMYSCDQEDLRYTVKKLRIPEFVEMFENKYPNITEALEFAIKNGVTRAFDKQFAIDSQRVVYYKLNKVGNLPTDKTEVKDIQFDPSYQHLTILLESNHEKTIGHSWS